MEGTHVGSRWGHHGYKSLCVPLKSHMTLRWSPNLSEPLFPAISKTGLVIIQTLQGVCEGFIRYYMGSYIQGSRNGHSESEQINGLQTGSCGPQAGDAVFAP